MSVKALSCNPARAPTPAGGQAGARAGTQAVERALSLMEIIATFGGHGMALADISARARMDPATARRLLLALMRHGFVTQDQMSRHYFLGLGFFSTAAAAANRFNVDDSRRRALRQLSHRAGVGAFFLRDGADMICIDMVHGAGQASPLDIGARRPIGAEAFGLALLASLPDDEGETIVIGNVRRYSRTPEDAIRRVGERMRDVRRLGYALDSEPVSNMWALAVAVTNRDGRPEGALGIALEGTTPAEIEPIAQTVMSVAQSFQHDVWRNPPGLRQSVPPSSPFDELDLSQCEMDACA